jgi:3',5'-cyclic AMP phosphodiesterase CpdA
MKHIIIGDLHGKDCWIDINIEAYDKIIFLGDYVDHWTLPDAEIYKNLINIIDLKKSNPEKVELLLGNHDVQYLYFPHYLCSGYRSSMQRLLTEQFNLHKDIFKIAYQKGNTLFSHAGLTNGWYKEFLAMPLIQQIADESDSVADLLNKADKTSQRWLLHKAGKSRGGEGTGGVTWADKRETAMDMLKGYHQLVGHTPVTDIETIRHENSSVTYIDVLDTKTCFHVEIL